MSKPEFVYVTYIETTPEKLWEALTNGDFTERYWFGVHLRSDWKVGSSFEMVDGDGKVSAEELETAPGRMHFDNAGSLDTNRDGDISSDELSAGLKARRERRGTR